MTKTMKVAYFISADNPENNSVSLFLTRSTIPIHKKTETYEINFTIRVGTSNFGLV